MHKNTFRKSKESNNAVNLLQRHLWPASTCDISHIPADQILSIRIIENGRCLQPLEVDQQYNRSLKRIKGGKHLDTHLEGNVYVGYKQMCVSVLGKCI